MLASLLVISLSTALLYRLVYRRCGNPLVAILLTGLAAAGSSIHWLARPHLLTMLFMVVFLSILERVREGRTGWLWALPAITILWTNLHGGFLVGIVIVGAYAAGELLRAVVARESDERRRSLRASAGYLAATAGCALASLVNPYGYHLHTHILAYFGDPYAMKYILEFRGTNFQAPAAIFLEIMLVLGLGGGGLVRAAQAVRGGIADRGFWAPIPGDGENMPIYVIAAAPIVAAPMVAWLKALAEGPIAGWLRTVFETFVDIGEELNPLERMWRTHVAPAAAMLLLALAVASPAAGVKFKPEYDPKAYPEKALALSPPWLRGAPGAHLFEPAQRIFTQDEWGDYLIYKLSPQGFKVFVDGRSDFYGGKFGQDYIDVMNVKYTWQQTLDRYGVDTILLPADAALAGALKESRRWRVAYDDGMAIVFRPAADAGAGMEQVFTGNTGGIGGRDPEITFVKHGIPEDHLNQIGGVLNP